MRKQRELPLTDADELDTLWERFPESSRRQLVSLSARLTALAAKAWVPSIRKESSDDKTKS
jgi:hypothetical protein